MSNTNGVQPGYPVGSCPVDLALGILGGKWKPMIVYHLLHGTQRFNELRRAMPTVTQQMLTMQLRELENDGLVERKVYAQVPPKVEYSLTASGWALKPILLELGEWAVAHVQNRQG